MPDAEPASEERKLATVLFADLVGSTALADEEDPERTRLILNRFYDAMTEEVERCGGTVEKFAGDAVMAAFGAPAALEDHAERALHAGLAMHRRLAALFGDQLALRIGVNTGEVVVGRPREGSSFVSGDAVNVAARLEQAAEPGTIVAGERTVAAARGAFEFSDSITFEARGKAGGVIGRPVLRALTLMRPRGVRGLPSVFIGRGAELDDLCRRYDRAFETGEPHLVSILGEAGVGKTRLTRELWAWLGGRSPEPIRRTGRTLSYGQGTTYWPLGEILKEHFGLSEDDPPATAMSRLANHPYLGLTLGMEAGEDLHPLVARERLHDAWADFIGGLVRERPVVLLVEDMHWAEDDLCDLIDTLVAQVEGPLLVIVTARPEMLDRRPAWGGAWGRTSAMRLEALPAADTGQLLESLIGTKVPPAIHQIVVERAEGNPFFVEELIGTLIDRGVMARSNGTWQFSDLPAGFSVPDTVQAVLAARIDLLPAAEKAALQAAAVIGRTFWTGPVYELLAGENPDIGVLEERDFVRRRPGSSMAGEREYVIKHALTREVAYASLPKARRARLHAGFAAWLERHAEARDELAPLLAHHYAEAIRPEDRDLAWADEDERAESLRQQA
ncbi:MAG TPA: adenylate/guanylate cyclase domain-containing protein, partial [Candidatus Limnocylindria bacterium]|nr:adenylate/guanylate cyclase domain-containing protein [Candidatus Limnocylindria bacterium]